MVGKVKFWSDWDRDRMLKVNELNRQKKGENKRRKRGRNKNGERVKRQVEKIENRKMNMENK